MRLVNSPCSANFDTNAREAADSMGVNEMEWTILSRCLLFTSEVSMVESLARGWRLFRGCSGGLEGLGSTVDC